MLSWYALHVRHQAELLVETALAGHCETFWPHRALKHHKRIIRRPWFPGYLFVRADWTMPTHRARVCGANHVLGIISSNGVPIPIPDVDIHALQALLEQRASVTLHPYVREGQRVRVTSGPLRGIEGVVVRFAGGARLVVQIELLGRAVATQIDGAACEAILRKAA